MAKSLFLAGASGAIGRRLAPLLIADGWRVTGATLSAEKAVLIRELGIEPVIVDAFDLNALEAAVAAARPELVMHQLTDLPPALDPVKMPEALARNARLRDEGTRNLIAAGVRAGARRLIAQSIAFAYAAGPASYGKDHPLAPTAGGAISLERQVMGAPIEGVVLRYGRLYGPGTGFDKPHGSPQLCTSTPPPERLRSRRAAASLGSTTSPRTTAPYRAKKQSAACPAGPPSGGIG
jgi:nucleoside-diphosphate-sugar epimerase